MEVASLYKGNRAQALLAKDGLIGFVLFYIYYFSYFSLLAFIVPANSWTLAAGNASVTGNPDENL